MRIFFYYHRKIERNSSNTECVNLIFQYAIKTDTKLYGAISFDWIHTAHRRRVRGCVKCVKDHSADTSHNLTSGGKLLACEMVISLSLQFRMRRYLSVFFFLFWVCVSVVRSVECEWKADRYFIRLSSNVYCLWLLYVYVTSIHSMLCMSYVCSGKNKPFLYRIENKKKKNNTKPS